MEYIARFPENNREPQHVEAQNKKLFFFFTKSKMRKTVFIVITGV